MNRSRHSIFSAQFPRQTTFRRSWGSVIGHWLLNIPRSLLLIVIRVYQLSLSPAQTYFLGVNGGCRYTPSCSNYAMDALREHGAVAGSFLAARRICRCHPWGGCGHDPVPPKTQKAPFKLKNLGAGI